MKIAIGSDHRGYADKEFIKQSITHFNATPIEWVDVGTRSNERTDFPCYARLVVEAMQEGAADRGVLLCGTGVGMAIAANRYKGIYAALVWNEQIARHSLENDKSNVLVIPADYVPGDQAVAIINAWLGAEFKGGRYQKRIDMIDAFGGA